MLVYIEPFLPPCKLYMNKYILFTWILYSIMQGSQCEHATVSHVWEIWGWLYWVSSSKEKVIQFKLLCLCDLGFFFFFFFQVMRKRTLVREEWIFLFHGVTLQNYVLPRHFFCTIIAEKGSLLRARMLQQKKGVPAAAAV